MHEPIPTTPATTFLDLPGIIRPSTPALSARLIAHHTAFVGKEAYGQMPLLLSLAETVAPSDGAQEILTSEYNTISMDASALLDAFRVWLYRKSGHLDHGGGVVDALTALTQSILDAGSDLANAGVVMDLAAWRVRIEQLLGGKDSIPLSWPCPGCSGDRVAMPLVWGATVFVYKGVAVCTVCAGIWSEEDTDAWAKRCYERMVEAACDTDTRWNRKPLNRWEHGLTIQLANLRPVSRPVD